MDIISQENINRILSYISEDYLCFGIKCRMDSINLSKYDIFTRVEIDSVTNIPGTFIYIWNDNNMRIGDMKFIYNNKFFICVQFPNTDKIAITSIILNLYRELTGCSLLFPSNHVKIRESISKLNIQYFTPIPKTYLEMMSIVTDCIVDNINIGINTKYNGYPCWLYISNDIPLTLITQVKGKKDIKYSIKGIISNMISTETKLMFCEMVNMDDIMCYILIDQLSDHLSYYDRFTDLVEFYKKSSFPDNVYITPNNIFNPGGSVLDYISNSVRSVADYTNIPVKSVLDYTNISTGDRSMSDHMNISVNDRSDGIIMYLPAFPYKMKLLSNVTIDLTFDKNCYKDTGNGWLTKNNVRNVIPQPSELDIDLIDKRAVFEISYSNKSILRLRNDRISGNPDNIIESILEIYKQDFKYANANVWSGNCILYNIILNRLFKRYIMRKHIPRSSKIIDIGSGYGGDIHIWKDFEYKVLAVEHDKERCNILKKNAKDIKSIIAYQADMLNVFSIMSRLTYKYRCITFMRSITNNSEDVIDNFFNLCKINNINKIIIISIVSDYVKKCSYKCECDNRNHVNFSIDVSEDKIFHKYSYDNKKEDYEDYKYSVAFFKSLGDRFGYNYDIEYQSNFTNMMGSNTKYIGISSSDVAFVYTKIHK